MKSAEHGAGAACTLRFADLELDLERRTVRRAGGLLRVASTSFELLRVLIERHPHVVTHRELMDGVWAGRCVTPDTLTQRVRLLRKALGEAEGGGQIVSVHGQGYRLAASCAHTAAAAPSAPPPCARRAPLRVIAYAVLAVWGAVLVSLVAWGPHAYKHFFKHLFG